MAPPLTDEQIQKDFEGRLKKVIEGAQILGYTETEARRMTEKAIDKVYRA